MSFYLTNKYLSIQKYQCPVHKCIKCASTCASACENLAQVRKCANSQVHAQVLAQVAYSHKCVSAQVGKYFFLQTNLFLYKSDKAQWGLLITEI